MNLKIEKVRYKNFLSAGNQFVELNLIKDKSTLVYGSNGSGKSALILESIYFGLYGKPLRKISKSNLINNINKKECLVELFFTINDSIQYKIIRGIKPNIFEIYKDDVLIDQTSQVRDYQKFFEEHILGISSTTFKQIILLGSTDFVPFMKLSIGVRRQVIEEMLGIQMFSDMNQIAKSHVNQLKKDIFSKEKDIEVIQASVKHIKSTIDDIKEKQKFNSEANKSKIFQLNNDLEALENSRAEYDAKTTEIIQKLPASNLRRKFEKLKLYENQLESNIKKVDSEISFYNDNDICSTCKSPLTPEHKDQCLNDSNDKKKSILDGINQLNIELDKAQDLINKEDLLQRELNETNIFLNQTQSEIDKIKHTIELYKEQQEKENSDDLINKQLSKADDLKDDYERDNKILKQLQLEGSEYEFLLGILKDDGIKTNIIKMYLPLINNKINKYLEILGFNIEFAFDEQFNECIKVSGRTDIQYGNFSEGEKLRVDLSILFAFREITTIKSGNRVNLLLMDEVLDSTLDLSGIDAFFNIVDVLDSNMNLFIISHKAEVADKFHASIEMKKINKFSKAIYRSNH